MISAVAGAAFAVMHFTGALEPYWLVHRQFARDLVKQYDDASRERDRVAGDRILSVEIAIKESARQAIRAKLDSIEIELRKLSADAAQSLREVLADQQRSYSRQLELIDFEIADLRRKQSGRTP